MCVYSNIINVKLKHYRSKLPFKVGCGHCIECLQDYQNQWTTRIFYELKSCNGVGVFLTLTYNNDKVPTIVVGDDEYLSLNRKHVPLAIKRFRINYERRYKCKLNFKYFLCGEYGKNTKRPHYHLLVFGVTQDDLQMLIDDWQNLYGHVDVQPVKAPLDKINRAWYKLAAYLGKYCAKSYLDIPEARKIEMQKDKDGKFVCWNKVEPYVQPTFRQCSNGIGIGYLTLQVIQYHRCDNIQSRSTRIEEIIKRRKIVVMGDEKELYFKLPRYYANKIYGEASDLSNEITYHIWRRHLNDAFKLFGQVPPTSERAYQRHYETLLSMATAEVSEKRNKEIRNEKNLLKFYNESIL